MIKDLTKSEMIATINTYRQRIAFHDNDVLNQKMDYIVHFIETSPEPELFKRQADLLTKALKKCDDAVELAEKFQQENLLLKFAPDMNAEVIRMCREAFKTIDIEQAFFDDNVGHAIALISEQKQEIEYLRRYGNKSCTQQADEALEELRNPPPVFKNGDKVVTCKGDHAIVINDKPNKYGKIELAFRPPWVGWWLPKDLIYA